MYIRLEFEWNESKSEANRAKHGLSFEVAMRVFDDPFALYEYNSEKDGEHRYHVIGSINGLVVVLVAYAVRKGEAK